MDIARGRFARKRQQLRDQVPILRSEPASVGVRPVNPDRLGGNVRAAFDLNEFKRDERVLIILNHAGRFDAKVVDAWIEHTSDLGRGGAEIDGDVSGGGVARLSGEQTSSFCTPVGFLTFVQDGSGYAASRPRRFGIYSLLFRGVAYERRRRRF